jgi:hypothetical protein
MTRSALIAGAVLGLALTLPALAETVSPSKVIADASSLEGKSVTVEGTVANFQTSKTMMGTVTAFQVCDEKCVVVIDETNASKYSNGDKATVTGTFQSSFKGPRRTFNNVVLIK